MGAGSTAIAATRGGRCYVGYDLDPAYARLSEDRIAADIELRSAAPRTVPTSTERKTKTVGQVGKRPIAKPRARKAASA